MNKQVYIDKIFKRVVKSCLQTHYNFVLEKDRDLEHKPEKSNIVCI